MTITNALQGATGGALAERPAGRLLLVRPIPKVDESWPGYQLRVANANGYAGISTIPRLCGESAQKMIAYPQWQLLRRLGIDVPQETCQQAMDLPKRIRRPHWYLLTTRSRVCPVCISSASEFYIPADWDSPLLTACKQHGLLLVDKCDRCSRHIDYRRSRLDACNCGREYRDARSVPIPDWYCSFEQVFGDYKDDADGDARRRNLKDIEAARVANTMALLARGETLRKKTYMNHAFVEVEHGVSLAKWFENWPNNFRFQLGEHFDLTKALPRLRARKIMRAQRFPVIEEQIGQIASIASLLRAAEPISIPELGLENGVRLKTFAKWTRLANKTIRCLNDAGELKIVVGKSDSSGRRSQYVDAQFANRIRLLHDRTYSVAEVAKLLKCRVTLVRVMIKIGQLPACTGFAGCRRIAVLRLQLEDIAAVLREFDRIAKPESDSRNIRIRLDAAVAYSQNIKHVENRYTAFLNGVRNGALNLYRAIGPASDLTGFSVEEKQLETWGRTRRMASFQATWARRRDS